MTSGRILEKLKERGSIRDFFPREAYGWMLYDKLVDHLYEQVRDANREQYERDYIPNRHASLHGLVPYTTHKHSMNMLIMADYIFHIVALITDSPSRQE